MEFVLGRFSDFNIAIAYSNSTFCGARTPSFCEFTLKLSEFQENEHTPELRWNFSSIDLLKDGSNIHRFPKVHMVETHFLLENL